MSNKEEWRKLDFAPYEVSAFGRIKSHIKRRGDPILKPSKDKDGYLHITLRVDGKRKSYRIHTLVLMVFKGECPEGHECNHIDGKHANNHVENLEWVSHSENIKHAIKNGFQIRYKGERHNRATKLKDRDVIEIKKMLLRGDMTKTEIAKIFNVSRELISHIYFGRNWGHISIPTNTHKHPTGRKTS